MSELITQLSSILDSEGLLTDPYNCALYAQDVFTKADPALAVARPTSVEQLSACVKAAHDNGVPAVPRGGGMSYTSGYVPKKQGSLIVDMGRMDRILEVNTDDMYVTVEAGCTWKALYERLDGTGWRTPFWGTLSGLYATVGGGASQNSIFWGSSLNGSAVESIVSLSVVLADGSLLDTGSAAHRNASPWYRHYGPDLTGIFLGDTGAMGFKATVTLKLIPAQPYRRGLSFASDTPEALLNFVGDVSRHQLASEVCGFDPFLQSQRLKRESLAKDIKALGGVMKSAGGFGKALKEGAKVALAGRGYMKDVKFSVHTLIEERYDATATAKEADIRKLAADHGLREIENSIPKIMRGTPFGPVNSMLGPEGERWACIHGVVPHSKATTVFNALTSLYESHRETLDKHGINTGYLFASIGPNATVIEPVFFWPDAMQELHKHAVEDEHLQKLGKGFPENPEARAALMQVRKEALNLFSEFGVVHMQIGKSYAYYEHLKPRSLELVTAIKQHLDPDSIINPGSLGLGLDSNNS